MKRLLAFVLVVMLSICWSAAYGELTERGDSASSTISLTVDASAESFEIVIPASMNLTIGDSISGNMTVRLKGGYRLVSDLTLYLEGSANGQCLVGNGGSVAYQLQVNGSDWSGSRTSLFHVEPGEGSEDVTATISVSVSALPPAGTYTDTLTFFVN